MRDIREVIRTDGIGSRLYAVELDFSWIGTITGNDEVRLELACLLVECLLVDIASLRIDVVVLDFVELAAEARCMAVGQVTAIGKL